ncbi:SMI1/KNR4 family protein [Streptomyces chartreusis]
MTRFDEVRASFWNHDGYGAQPPLTEEMVQDAERLLGVSLPASLLTLLRVRNGGGVADRWNVFPTRMPTS